MDLRNDVFTRELLNQNLYASIYTSTKGLYNPTGHNNCFLNSAVQVLWQLDTFRTNFRLVSEHACFGPSCVFCALKIIFTQFQFNTDTVLPPDVLRRAMADAFVGKQRFQLGLMDDAAECFENILRHIHFSLCNGTDDDSCNHGHCITHHKFAMTVVEQSKCQCGATSEPLSFIQLIQYVSTHSLTSSRTSTNVSFGRRLRNAFGNGNVQSDCPVNCGFHSCWVTRILMNVPEVVSIGLIWNSDQPSTDDIRELVDSIGMEITLIDMFDSVVDRGLAEHCRLSLVGMVCYYGKHYSTFFFHSKKMIWISFDDATVTELGASWDVVVSKCVRGRYQPLLLLYQSDNRSPIVTASAPKSTKLIERNIELISIGTGNVTSGANRNASSTTELLPQAHNGYKELHSASISDTRDKLTAMHSGTDHNMSRSSVTNVYNRPADNKADYSNNGVSNRPTFPSTDLLGSLEQNISAPLQAWGVSKEDQSQVSYQNNSQHQPTNNIQTPILNQSQGNQAARPAMNQQLHCYQNPYYLRQMRSQFHPSQYPLQFATNPPAYRLQVGVNTPGCGSRFVPVQYPVAQSNPLAQSDSNRFLFRALYNPPPAPYMQSHPALISSPILPQQMSYNRPLVGYAGSTATGSNPNMPNPLRPVMADAMAGSVQSVPKVPMRPVSTGLQVKQADGLLTMERPNLNITTQIQAMNKENGISELIFNRQSTPTQLNTQLEFVHSLPTMQPLSSVNQIPESAANLTSADPCLNVISRPEAKDVAKSQSDSSNATSDLIKLDTSDLPQDKSDTRSVNQGQLLYNQLMSSSSSSVVKYSLAHHGTVVVPRIGPDVPAGVDHHQAASPSKSLSLSIPRSEYSPVIGRKSARATPQSEEGDDWSIIDDSYLSLSSMNSLSTICLDPSESKDLDSPVDGFEVVPSSGAMISSCDLAPKTEEMEAKEISQIRNKMCSADALIATSQRSQEAGDIAIALAQCLQAISMYDALRIVASQSSAPAVLVKDLQDKLSIALMQSRQMKLSQDENSRQQNHSNENQLETKAGFAASRKLNITTGGRNSPMNALAIASKVPDKLGHADKVDTRPAAAVRDADLMSSSDLIQFKETLPTIEHRRLQKQVEELYRSTPIPTAALASKGLSHQMVNK